jgi:multiple sugar transport system substrate-binding protein
MSLAFIGAGCEAATAETTAAAAETTAAAAETTAAAAETTAAAAEGGSIKAFWFQWAPAEYLQKVSEAFTAETGIKFELEVTTAENWVAKYNTEMIAGSDAWDLIVADSQDMGTMATGEHFVNMTDWIKANGVDKLFTAASMTYYAEFPKGSGQYWGVPCEGDSLGWAYRKDLFEDPDNMEAFKAKYGYDLAVPKDYDMMRDIAEFFHDPDNNFYGIAVYGDNGYDSSAMLAEGLIWAYGGDLGDYSTYQVDGLLNSEGAIAGLERYRSLYEFVPPGFGNAFYIETNDAFVGGLVPMSVNYYAFFPGLANPDTNPFAADTGYFTCPPQKGVDGTVRQVSPLGGMSISINKYSKKQDLAMKWMEWWIKPETQLAWAKAGGFTCNAEVLASQEFLDATPFNPSFKASMETLKDFWAVPEYAALLRTFSENIGPYITTGTGTAEGALQATVDNWTEIFDQAGYYQ